MFIRNSEKSEIFLLIFSTQNSLKLGDALSPLPFNHALQYAIGKAQETNLRLDINGVGYADGDNLIGDDITKIERSAEVLLNGCNEIALTVNIGKPYME